MPARLDDTALKQLFLDARTHRAWQPRDVPDNLLKELVDLTKMAPTANNSLPARLVFVKSKAAKERLKPHLSAGNVDKTMAAPVTVIVGYDLKFYAHPPKGQDPLSAFADKPEQARTMAFRNSSLQGGYLILAARRSGSIAGPCPGSTMPASTRSSLPVPTSNRTFCATWASATRRVCGRGGRGSISMRSGKFCSHP